MAKKFLFIGLAIVFFNFPFSVESQPAVNQSNISVYRDENTTTFFKMYVYVDNRIAQTSYKNLFGTVKYNDIEVSRGATVSIPINDGVHSIYVKAGPLVSNTIAFSVERSIASFVITLKNDEHDANLNTLVLMQN
jgi:hypothetical protein